MMMISNKQQDVLEGMIEVLMLEVEEGHCAEAQGMCLKMRALIEKDRMCEKAQSAIMRAA